jgi:hypothetical protein
LNYDKKILRILKKIFIKIFFGNKLVKYLLIRKYGDTFIIHVDGGLASQVSKYAFGMYLQHQTGNKVLFDVGWFKKCGKSVDGRHTRKLEIKKVFPKTRFFSASRFLSFLFKVNFSYLNPEPFILINAINCNSPRYYSGYYGNNIYFYENENQLRKELVFNDIIINGTKEVTKEIINSSYSVAIHIRRGDYVGSIHDVLGVEYFINAIDYIKKIKMNIYLFFFTNDRKWVEENIIPLLESDTPYLFYDGHNDTGYYDMYLMSQCDANVISNSGFSLIPAWLNTNPEKIIVIPKKWLKENDKISTKGIDHAFHIRGCVYF